MVWVVSSAASENFSTLFLLFNHVIPFYMFLTVPPRFVNKMKNAIFVAGEEAQFTCVIQSAPSPKIRYGHLTYTCSYGNNETFWLNSVRSLKSLCVLLSVNYCCLAVCSCSRWFKDGRLLTDQEKYQTYSELRSGVLVLVIKNLTERDLIDPDIWLYPHVTRLWLVFVLQLGSETSYNGNIHYGNFFLTFLGLNMFQNIYHCAEVLPRASVTHPYWTAWLQSSDIPE